MNNNTNSSTIDQVHLQQPKQNKDTVNDFGPTKTPSWRDTDSFAKSNSMLSLVVSTYP